MAKTKVTDSVLRKLVSIDQYKQRQEKLQANLPYAGFGTAVAMEGSCFDVAAVNELLRKPLASTR